MFSVLLGSLFEARDERVFSFFVSMPMCSPRIPGADAPTHRQWVDSLIALPSAGAPKRCRWSRTRAGPRWGGYWGSSAPGSRQGSRGTAYMRSSGGGFVATSARGMARCRSPPGGHTRPSLRTLSGRRWSMQSRPCCRSSAAAAPWSDSLALPAPARMTSSTRGGWGDPLR